MTRQEFAALPEAERDVILDRARQLLEGASWIVAKTMPQNPHEYSPRKTWSRAADFEWVVETIRAAGVREKFRGNWYVVLSVGAYYYWTMGFRPASTILINRKSVTQRAQDDAARD